MLRCVCCDANALLQLEPLLEEMVTAGCHDMGVEPKEGYVERLCAYARSVSHFPTAVKEVPWRNGYFARMSADRVDALKSDPTPRHSEMWTELDRKRRGISGTKLIL